MKCNLAIGLADDDIDTLLDMANYLLKAHGKQSGHVTEKIRRQRQARRRAEKEGWDDRSGPVTTRFVDPNTLRRTSHTTPTIVD